MQLRPQRVIAWDYCLVKLLVLFNDLVIVMLLCHAAKENKKAQKTERNKKAKEKTSWKSQPGDLYDEEDESYNKNGFIGVGRCRKLLASCPNRSGSAKFLFTANICGEDGKIDPECFSPAQAFAFGVMDRMYYPTFVCSSLYCKHQLDILTGSKVFLSDVLYNEHAMFYFMEFLEQEGVRHMLEFWLTADNFQSMLKDKLENGEYNSQQALDDAMIIYDRYLSMQANLPLGFDDITRIEIENNICREGGPLPDCLSIPLEHILCLLEEVFFPSFLQSNIYFKYLNELLNSVSDSSNPSGSSEDNESRITKVEHTNEKTRLVTSFGSELDLTENPDAIWHRPNAGPLSIGHINEFGIYEPIFAPEPDHDRHNTSTAAKLGKAMRKLVSGGEDKVKEEMAWKIAKMMIEDVKTQTEN
ncbi:hypothetical protein QZH41_008339 [Actinostola sp. cb2023]|nr:hypothetical protein QZH41_008339 [Actinostola sp. cb2023]